MSAEARAAKARPRAERSRRTSAPYTTGQPEFTCAAGAPTSPALEGLAAEFLAELALVRRYSPHTVRAYRTDVQAFCAGFADRHRRPATAGDLTRLEVRAECVRVWGCLGNSSLRRRLAALRSLGDFLVRRGLRPDNEVRMVRGPALRRHPPSVPSEAQLARLCEADTGRHNIRDQAIVEVLYGAGLRVSECVGLDVANVRFDGDQVLLRVLGKGQRERIVPAGSKAAAALQRYLDERGPHRGALFESRCGRLRDRTVRAMLRRRAAAAGVNAGCIWPHLLRHACATHMLLRGCDIRWIAAQLGHRSLSSTQIYTDLDIRHVTRVYFRCHPRARSSDVTT